MGSLIRLNQVRRAGIPSAAETEEQFALGRYFDAACLSSDLVGDFVFISGASVSGVFQVTTVDPTLDVKMPAYGVITQKYTTTSCLVHVGPGIVSATALGITLIPRKRYFIGNAGRISATLPVAPSGGVAFVQVVGHALDASSLLLVPNYGLSARRG